MDELAERSGMIRDFLEMAVMVEVSEILRGSVAITDWHIEEAQRRMAFPRESGAGEELMFRLPDTQRSMRDLIEALAILACMQGGVEFAGLHFEMNHGNPIDCVKMKEITYVNGFKQHCTAD